VEGDALVARLVERAVGERQDVRAQDLEQVKVVALVHLELLDQLYSHSTESVPAFTCPQPPQQQERLTVDESPELRLARLGDQRLLEHDLVHQHLNVRPAYVPPS